MCMGVPRQIVEVVDRDHGIVRIDAGAQGMRDISAAILFDEGHDLGVGDWVDVHLGFALDAMTEEEASESLDWLSELATADPFIDDTSVPSGLRRGDDRAVSDPGQALR